MDSPEYTLEGELTEPARRLVVGREEKIRIRMTPRVWPEQLGG